MSFPSHLLLFSLSLCPFQPPTFFPTFPPPRWLCCRVVWIMRNTANRTTSITPGRLANKTARHPGRRPLQFATPKPAHTLVQLIEGGEVKKAREEDRTRWAADLYAFIRARPWSWMPLRGTGWQLTPTHTQHVGMLAAHTDRRVYMYRQKAAEIWKKMILCTYRAFELHLYEMTQLSHTHAHQSNQPRRLTGY